MVRCDLWAIVWSSILLFGSSFTCAKSECKLRLDNRKECLLKRSYDFIVIGAGGAGAVIASRLSEVRDWDVLVLEAGGEETFQSRFPYLPTILENTAMDWNYTTTKQKEACKNFGGRCKYPRGRVLGGSSSTNYMVYMRGQQEDFNRWEADGNTGWSFKDVLPYFQKAENFVSPRKGSTLGKGGYLPLTENEPCWFTDVISSSLKRTGLPERDLNDGLGGGFMPMQVTVFNGERYSTARAYLDPFRNRVNLDVFPSSLVTKIIFDGTKAVGVQFEKNGHSYRVNAKKEVIVSAGSINSPHILMLSGVGPEEHLKSLGIPVVANLPVGQNFQDHVGIFLVFKIGRKSSFNFVSSLQQYMTNGTGILSFPLGGLVVVLTNSSRTTLDLPDIQYHIGITGNADKFYVSAYYNHPESIGSVSLKSTSPHDPPLVDPKYLTSGHDKATMREVLDLVFKLANTKPLKDYGLVLSSETSACEGVANYHDCLCEQHSQTFFHPVGTCKMGPSTDPSAVVDSELKVRNLRGLRVVDASVIPRTTTSNTLAPTIMVAEKAADLIKKDHWASIEGSKYDLDDSPNDYVDGSYS